MRPTIQPSGLARSGNVRTYLQTCGRHDPGAEAANRRAERQTGRIELMTVANAIIAVTILVATIVLVILEVSR